MQKTGSAETFFNWKLPFCFFKVNSPDGPPYQILPVSSSMMQNPDEFFPIPSLKESVLFSLGI